ncbi:hypothetical protein B0J13DRAFT_20714 [Dactylonectria estremocensis]|uniref:Uncharacterized protein n=1 Tax=Dactylonectria estremocensis TaxID=1079267 RepID=A0A9P9FJV2_9HYPO|nr:hypothetical protein B0J13DRAFT_20714 [Dactylonectria estremocensis]
MKFQQPPQMRSNPHRPSQPALAITMPSLVLPLSPETTAAIVSSLIIVAPLPPPSANRSPSCPSPGAPCPRQGGSVSWARQPWADTICRQCRPWARTRNVPRRGRCQAPSGRERHSPTKTSFLLHFDIMSIFEDDLTVNEREGREGTPGGWN